MIIKKAICDISIFISIILAFFEKNTGYSNDINEDIFGNKIIILKRVKSLKQLRRTEKELVRLNYKEAIIKGFTLKGIQQYIASKTKIWIEWSCLEYLKRSEEQENREWYYHMARDHFAYVGAYRKCIDELEQLKKELWNIIMDSKIDMNNRIQATKELHSLSKTCTLLIKDLPFVTILSKFYDEGLINLNYNNMTQSKNAYSNRNNQEIVRDFTYRNEFDKSANLDNPFDSNGTNDEKTFVDENGLRVDKSQSRYKRLDDNVFEDMQRQMHITDHLKGKCIEEITDEELDKIITPQHKESIRKLKEIFRYINKFRILSITNICHYYK
jgi:hypothetical protein